MIQMLKLKLKEYRDNKKARAKHKRFRRGFSWAMKSYYLDNQHVSDIRDMMYLTGNDFYNGARHAIAIIEGRER